MTPDYTCLPLREFQIACQTRRIFLELYKFRLYPKVIFEVLADHKAVNVIW